MRGVVRTVGLAVLVVVVALVAGTAARSTVTTVAAPATAATATAPPTAGASPRPTPPVTQKTTPSSTLSIDMMSMTLKNKLYTAGKVPAVSCKVPGSAPKSKTALLAYARVMVDCMYRAWAPVVARADVYFDRPVVVAYKAGAKSASAACDDGPTDTDAYYEPSARTICFEWGEFVGSGDATWDLVDFQTMLAHEFGHHLQTSVGILTTYWTGHAQASKAVRLEDERRLELQASCFGAAFLGANRRPFRLTGWRLEMWEDQVTHTGDEYAPDKVRDHGSRKNHGYWSLRAFDSTNPSSCNTFVAPAKRVS
ncbi:neutral zinc metallopeptidase [Kribbella sp. NBC_00889]|uniref:neutral zinc metallopeptidase n=1 Tax=Kribbella sp. NBC_00889 TaxID=2975974 RepID=UPI00386F33F3|nr:neutral zinc metallopeptidase [Kribbella sp. NBC_00889]